MIAVGTTLGSLVLGTLAGYGFARFHFRASEAVRFLVLVTRMAPRMVLVVPYYLMMQRLGLLDTYTGLLIAYVSFALPFSIWLLIGFFVDVPLDVEEAAMIDGCSPLGVLVRIRIPHQDPSGRRRRSSPASSTSSGTSTKKPISSQEIEKGSANDT